MRPVKAKADETFDIFRAECHDSGHQVSARSFDSATEAMRDHVLWLNRDVIDVEPVHRAAMILEALGVLH